MRGGQGFCAGVPHGLQFSLRCQVIPRLLSLSDSLHRAFKIHNNVLHLEISDFVFFLSCLSLSPCEAFASKKEIAICK